MKIIDALYRRKSVRNFMDKEIEKDLLERIEGRLRDTELFDKNEKISCGFR